MYYEETWNCGNDLSIVRHIPGFMYDIPVNYKKIIKNRRIFQSERNADYYSYERVSSAFHFHEENERSVSE